MKKKRHNAGEVSQTRIFERDQIVEIFAEWHLDTFFEPFNPSFVIHVARMQGFLGGFRSRKGSAPPWLRG